MKTVIRRWCKDCRLSPGHIEYREEKGHHWVIDYLNPTHEEAHKLTDRVLKNDNYFSGYETSTEKE